MLHSSLWWLSTVLSLLLLLLPFLDVVVVGIVVAIAAAIGCNIYKLTFYFV